MAGQSEYLTVEEAAGKLRLHIDTMRRYMREGRLRGAKVGKRYLIPATEIQKYLDAAMTPEKDEAGSIEK